MSWPLLLDALSTNRALPCSHNCTGLDRWCPVCVNPGLSRTSAIRGSFRVFAWEA